MDLWVKICGNTSLADAEVAVKAGADALGFIFASSPRQVNVDQVAAISSRLPDSVEKIGVFVDADLASIANAIENSGLTGVQLHFHGDADLVGLLRERFGTKLRILQVVHFGEATGLRLLDALRAEPSLDGVLVDSRTAAAVGGTGTSFDWKAARETIFVPQSRLKLIAAGGLSPDNVAEAIRILEPWGVDVVSGVERSRGEKDHEKVRAFVRNARAAGGTLLK